MKTTSNVYVNGKLLRVSPRDAIGKGGEADVYSIGQGQAIKLYKSPDHPDFQMQPEAREAARRRIAEQQQKLPLFPRNLPDRVIAPVLPATMDARGQHIVGYTMPFLQGTEVLLRYADRAFRDSSGITPSKMTQILRGLHETVSGVHDSGVVIGDFNDLNVLVDAGGNAFLIDADSFQFGRFLCRTFTTRFLDPTLCEPGKSELVLSRPHSVLSDWYAFCVILMQCLLYVDPYGGLYRPKAPVQRIAHHLRPLQRITVFHPAVRYPKPAIPYGVLPDDLLHFFHQTFEHDQRQPFPLVLLDTLRWTTCKGCGIDHARLRCPRCHPLLPAPPAAIAATVQVRGRVTAKQVYRTPGVILSVAYQRGRLRYLVHENGSLKREDGLLVANGELRPGTNFRLYRDATLIGREGQISIVQPAGNIERISVDNYRALPVFDSNDDHVYWLQAGQLWRSPQPGSQYIGPEYIGDVLAGQTLFWSGPDCGFGFYRAGNLTVAFVFDAKQGGLNDSVQLPLLHGELYDACCVFTTSGGWFFAALQEGGRLIHHCFVISPNGSVAASTQAEAGDGSWLGSNLRGKCAVGAGLATPTDDGIVRVEACQNAIAVTRTFPDTEPFVHAATQLIAGSDGIYAVGQRDIHLLTIRTS